MAEGFLEDQATSQVRAPPLTLENVFNAVKSVRSWRKLCSCIHDPFTHVLDNIEGMQYDSDEDSLKAVIEWFLSGRVMWYKQPSWRRVMWSLYKINEFKLAENIKSYAEPLQDSTMTVVNIIGVMDKIPVNGRMWVWHRMGLIMLNEFKERYPSEEQQIRACSDFYVNFHPEPSWVSLCHGLYKEMEVNAARKAKAFVPLTDPTLAVKNVVEVMQNVAVERRKKVWGALEIPVIQLMVIYEESFNKEQRMDACADIYVNCHPESSWTDLCLNLYRKIEITAAKRAKLFIQQSDPTLTVENVLGVMEKVTNGRAEEIWKSLIDVFVLLNDIISRCSTEREIMQMYADVYVNCDPSSSWEHIARELYQNEEAAALEEVQSYLNPKDLTLTTERLMELFSSVNDRYFGYPGFSNYLDTPSSKTKEFDMNYRNLTRRKEAYLDYYVLHHPAPSWSTIARLLHWCGQYKQAVLVENTYTQVSERTRLNFEAAMKDGAVWIRNGNTLFMGPGGSGKTHTLLALLQEDPPAIRESTACAKKPIRAVAQFKIGVSGTAHFIRITDDQYSEMLANSAEICSAVPQSVVGPSDAPQPRLAAAFPSSSIIQVPESTSTSELAEATSKMAVRKLSVQDELRIDRPVGFMGELQCRMQAKSKTSEKLDDQDLMDVKDSGGQPMFHEVLPALVTDTMFGVLTVKLNEPLDSHPLVEYYVNGNRIGEPFRSPFTHLQTLHHCLMVLQSTCKSGTCPKIIFVGTHKDLEHECPQEDRREKNRKLLSIIPPEMKDNVIYNGESLLFCINAKAPGNDDRKLMSHLRLLMIKELQKLPKVRIPLRYFSLENAFQRLAKYQKRAVLSIDECLKEAAAYHFTRESLDDVLQYLHSLKLIMHYRDILPDVVFINAQVILDKITELVEYSIELRAKPCQGVTVGGLEKFKSCGIVTVEILSKFTSGYVSGLFEEKHLILLFKKLLIIAEIGKGKFLMPCLLEEEKVLLFSSSESVVPSLLLYFGENDARLGVYCFLLASLITDAKWKLLTEDGNPVQLSRNRARFALPENNPGCVTITDSFSTFFHLSVEFPDQEEISETKALEICEEVCPIIRETILTHIRKASYRLNYKDSSPEVAFLCSGHDETIPPHPAVISKHKLLTCTKCPGSVCCSMTERHALWLGEGAPSSYEGVESELGIKDLRIVQKAVWDARSKWYNLGLELHIDPGTLDVIEGNDKGINDKFRAMLTTWLKMVECKPSWEALAKALRSPTVGYAHLAECCVSQEAALL